MGNGTKLGNYTLSPSHVVPREQHIARVTPPHMSTPAQLKRDVELSRQVISHLDSLTGVPQLTEILVGNLSCGDSALQLDIQLMYLRVVHHYCYYSSVWGEDEWDLVQKAGITFLRGTGEAGQPGEDLWVRRHQCALNDFLASAALPRPAVQTLEDEPLRTEWANFCAQQTSKVNEGRYGCLLCKKNFQTADYAHRHVHNRHQHKLADVREEVYETLMAQAYLADKDRLMPPPQMSPVV